MLLINEKNDQYERPGTVILLVPRADLTESPPVNCVVVIALNFDKHVRAFPVRASHKAVETLLCRFHGDTFKGILSFHFQSHKLEQALGRHLEQFIE